MANKVSYEFDPWDLADVEKPNDRTKVREAQEEIADYLKTKVLSIIGKAESPLEGGEWEKKLSEKYKNIKKEISGSTKANMELYGDMLDALDVKIKPGGKLEYGVFGKEQALKADGHNHTGVFGKSKFLPPREFIPKRGKPFQDEIINDIRDILEEFGDDDGEG